MLSNKFGLHESGVSGTMDKAEGLSCNVARRKTGFEVDFQLLGSRINISRPYYESVTGEKTFKTASGRTGCLTRDTSSTCLSVEVGGIISLAPPIERIDTS
jgi:hypothetical protein